MDRRTLLWAGAAALLVTGSVAAAIPLPLPALASTAYLALTAALITLIDRRHFIIPDLLSLPAIPSGLLATILVFHPDDWTAGLREGALGAAAAGGAFLLLRAAYFRFRGIEGLGLGDVKLAAVAGAWLGPDLLAPACLAASLAGIAAVLLRAALSGEGLSGKNQLPFGSFISPAIFAFWLWKLVQSGGGS